MTDTTLTGTWDIDPSHTRIGFATRHAMVTRVRGAFNDVTGQIEINLEDPSLSRAELTVQMTSVDTRSQQRDDHLRSTDFFDTETYPEMAFSSTRIEEVDEDSFIVTGDLTIKDRTRSIGVPLRFMGIDTDPFGNVRAGFEGSRRIDRRDWGISWNTPLDSGGLLVSDRIQLEFELSLIKQV
ncbi:YceI family protein [Brachybacterium sp. AOP3-A1-3]|uniref:YceI family protein n=1 Tax=Brachybacterium sp. AOP3-A1-3 TaxID=3457699 RepID=UPI004034F39E